MPSQQPISASRRESAARHEPRLRSGSPRRRLKAALGWLLVSLAAGEAAAVGGQPTVGGGTTESPAVGPGPSHGVGDGDHFVLVKNWDFGRDGTVPDISTLSQHFQYHDQFGTIANGTKYGSYTVAPDAANSLSRVNQPVEGVNTDRPVRKFAVKSLKTFVVPLDGADRVHPTDNKAGCGSFQAKWTLPAGGKRLGKSLIWETRVRFKTIPYYWFAIWNCGSRWDQGPEIDLVESFGYDNGGGFTNFDGHSWHSSVVGGEEATYYHSNWLKAMASRGVTDFNPSKWHTWTLLYRKNDTFSVFMDGVEVQNGSTPWAVGAVDSGATVKMSFIFDGSWGHSRIKTVNQPLDASALKDAVYEWDYSRVYLSENDSYAKSIDPAATD